MNKLTAIALRPIVYALDLCIALTGAQTFKEANDISEQHFQNILNGHSKKAKSGTDNHPIQKELDFQNRF